MAIFQPSICIDVKTWYYPFFMDDLCHTINDHLLLGDYCLLLLQTGQLGPNALQQTYIELLITCFLYLQKQFLVFYLIYICSGMDLRLYWQSNFRKVCKALFESILNQYRYNEACQNHCYWRIGIWSTMFPWYAGPWYSTYKIQNVKKGQNPLI